MLRAERKKIWDNLPSNYSFPRTRDAVKQASNVVAHCWSKGTFQSYASSINKHYYIIIFIIIILFPLPLGLLDLALDIKGVIQGSGF
jgi:hypothetical protein